MLVLLQQRAGALRCKIRAPALIAASGLRRLCPSTAMNCSRSSAVSRSVARPFCNATSIPPIRVRSACRTTVMTLWAGDQLGNNRHEKPFRRHNPNLRGWV